MTSAVSTRSYSHSPDRSARRRLPLSKRDSNRRAGRTAHPEEEEEESGSRLCGGVWK